MGKSLLFIAFLLCNFSFGRGYGLSANSSQLWPKGVVPFTVEGEVPSGELRAAMKEWQDRTGFVRFINKRETDYNYLVIKTHKDKYSTSYVGIQGGAQDVLLSDKATIGVILHELGQALGLRHEHQRPDRDDFVTLTVDPIKANNYEINYGKFTDGAIKYGDYDFKSIMHYSETTITDKAGHQTPHNDKLSVGDIDAVCAMYRSARMFLKVPDAAIVYLEGVKMNGTGPSRLIHTPPLEKGIYTMKIEVVVGSNRVERTAKFRGGEKFEINFLEGAE